MTVVLDESHPAVEELRLPRVLAALADPGRLATVRALAQLGESACNRLLRDAGLAVSRSTFSHHQKVLREAGIIQVRVRGSERILSLRSDDLDRCFPGLLDAVLKTQPEFIGSP
ncbi:ArsR/SmtB family transcription factor [Pseudofrankia inefficax]|uniref:Regulatory protein ArsR n=1 Tax=Pseudofrankia inefficax (strain DSM 45817 / CECT 9037 / DDB 130130 / EuI1c) TaxID=298654 RepID=E3J3P4_PSEI1|nr:helix-turn-helix domain-containing protein [Pseudofrankia inefficax]ADP79381.1 regulatory protein ArsR [Pseudofrankia inefficax]